MIALPSDLEIAESLVPVRAAVLEATERVRSPRRSTRYRVTRNLIIATAAAIALTAGAIVVALQTPEYIAGNVSCYEHPSLDARVATVQGPDRSSRPIDACALVWEVNGFVGAPGHPEPGPGTVPEMTACTLPDGSVGVFPREGRPAEDFCAALGLAVWDSD